MIITPKHHVIVRITHWLNIPLLLGLILSGISIYWAAPVYKHAPDPRSGNTDYFVDAGIWLCAHIPWMHAYAEPPNWIYNHFSFGTGMLAVALRLHWLFVYLFMLNGLLYIIGLALGGGYRALLPRRSDAREALLMIRYYLGLPWATFRRRAWPHPLIATKYNALQRSAYFAMPVAGALSVLTGWAMHKPMQLKYIAAIFGGYDWARIWHFWLMWLFVLFVIPHVILVAADGWDTFRSMITGWSSRRSYAIRPDNSIDSGTS